MRLSAGWTTFIIGLALLWIAGNFYQQSLASDQTRYVQTSRSTGMPAGEGYVCPMHPQVRQESPGDCSICGMDLVRAEDSNKGPTGMDCACCADGDDAERTGDKETAVK